MALTQSHSTVLDQEVLIVQQRNKYQRKHSSGPQYLEEEYLRKL